MIQEAKFLINLSCAVINGSSDAPTVPTDFNQDLFCELSQFHGLETLVYYGIKQYNLPFSEKTLKTFEGFYQAQIFRYASLSAELEYMCNLFYENKINYTLIKGTIIRDLYPKPEMRTSLDADFIYNIKDRNKIEKLMLNNGFVVDNYDEGVDCYKKPPFVCFEMHTKVMPNRDRLDCFDGINDRFIPFSKYKGASQLSLNDSYLLLITHTAKHFFSGGTGIRPIIDLYLFNKEYKNQLDQSFINKRLESIQLQTFANELNILAEYWFNKGKPSSVTEKLAKYIAFSGIFGTQDNLDAQTVIYEQNGIVFDVKPNLFQKTFLSYKNMCLRYPYLRKYPFLLPFCYIIRIFSGIFSKRVRNILISDHLAKAQPDIKNVDNIKELFKDLNII